MTPKRKQTQDYILKAVKQVDPSGKNAKRYANMFANMTDKDFDTYMNRIKDHQEVLYVYFAPMKDNVTVQQLIDAAHKLNVKLFERIRMWDEPTQQYYLTTQEYCILQLPIRRMSQFADHKLSVAEGDNKIDMLSGQVVKPDQAASISQVEVQALYARGLTKTITEFLKYRGGDVNAFSQFRQELEEQGTTSIDRDSNSVNRAAVVLDAYMSGMHLWSNASGVY